MRIVFDLDNTLADEQGLSLRPGIMKILTDLSVKKHELFIWTNSKKGRALSILNDLGIRKYFKKIIAREDYDPDFQDIPKDCRKIKADLFLDDDPKEVSFNSRNGIRSLLVSSYRKNKALPANDIEKIKGFIFEKENFFSKIFK